MPNPTPLSTDEFLRRYTSQASAPQPVAPTGNALSAEEFAARFTAQSTPPPAPAPETQGGVFSPSSPTDTPLQAGVKTALNLPGSAWNFAKGLVQTMNPVQIAKNIGQIPGEYAALKEEGGGLGSVVKELPGATYEGLVPEAGRALIRGDIEGAQKAVTEDPVGSVAPFVIGARQGAKVIDRVTQGRAQATMKDYVQNIDKNVGRPIPRGTGTNLGGAIDTAIEKTGQLVTKPVEAVASGIGEGISTGTRFGVSRATGLQPETISQIQKAPEAFTKENMAKADRADLANEVKTRLDERIESLSDTGAGYQNLRRSGASVAVDRNWLDDVIKETTGLEVKKGKLTTSGTASIRDRQDVNALQTKYDLWKPVFSKGSLSADEFFNFRTDMAGLAKLGREVSKSGPLENLSSIMRGKFNTEYRKQIKGLEETDADFASMSKELKELRKGILDKNDNLTDQAINRIANATGKGKDQLLSRLEEISPGISQKIKVMKAIEDVQNASGIKVGTYDRAALLGSSFVFGGALPGIITAVMTSPNVAVPMLRQYGLLKNAKAVNAVVQALKESAGKVNAIPSTLDMDVKQLEGKKIPMGLSIEDVSKNPIKSGTKYQAKNSYTGEVIERQVVKDDPANNKITVADEATLGNPNQHQTLVRNLFLEQYPELAGRIKSSTTLGKKPSPAVGETATGLKPGADSFDTSNLDSIKKDLLDVAKEYSEKGLGPKNAKYEVVERDVPIDKFIRSIGTPDGARMESIRKGGITEGVTAIKEGSRYRIVDGNHRVQLAKEKGLTSIKVLVAEPKTNLGTGATPKKTSTDISSRTFYRAQPVGDGLVPRPGHGNSAMFGNAPHFATNKVEAQMYGNNIKQFSIKPEANVKIFNGTYDLFKTVNQWADDTHGQKYRMNTETNSVIDRWAKENNIDVLYIEGQEGVVFNPKMVKDKVSTSLDENGTPIVKGEGKQLPSLADPVEGGTWYHGTTAENKASILKNGINTSLNKKGFAEQPEAFYMADKVEAGMYGGDTNAVGIRVKKGEQVKTLSVSDKEWGDAYRGVSGAQASANALRSLRAKGYDAINHGDEIEVLNPSKFEVFDPTVKPKTTLGR